MQIRSVGIDLGKTTFHLVALGDNGKVLLKGKFNAEAGNNTFTANMQTYLIGMEAWQEHTSRAALFDAQGHDVKLIPAKFVKPLVKRTASNDFINAEAIR